MPIPNSFPQSEENQHFNYSFFSTSADGSPPPDGRWTHGPSMDGKGEFHVKKAAPLDGEPQLAAPDPRGHAQTEQMTGHGIIDQVMHKLGIDQTK